VSVHVKLPRRVYEFDLEPCSEEAKRLLELLDLAGHQDVADHFKEQLGFKRLDELEGLLR
jgi:hypothetical protein